MWKPVVHGRDHRPGGSDPNYAGPWHNVGGTGEPALLAGSNSTPSAAVPNPVPCRFRLSVGPPNVLNPDGTIRRYTEHQIELQGDLTGLAPGDTVFILPVEYRHDHDVPVPGHDDAGDYVACRLYTDGSFVYGVA